MIRAQQNEIDNFRNVISKQKKDTTEVGALINIAWFYLFINPDSSIIVAK